MTTPSPIKDKQIDIHRVGGSPVTVLPFHTPTGFASFVKNAPGTKLQVDIGTDLSLISSTVHTAANMLANAGNIVTVDLGLVPNGKRSQLAQLNISSLVDTFVDVYENQNGVYTQRAYAQTRTETGTKQIDYESMGLYLDSTGTARWTLAFQNTDKNDNGSAYINASQVLTDTP